MQSDVPNGPHAEITRKCLKGFPSATQVKHGVRVAHAHHELLEKFGPNPVGPCGSRRRIQERLSAFRAIHGRISSFCD
jgi:hypothetical protein